MDVDALRSEAFLRAFLRGLDHARHLVLLLVDGERRIVACSGGFKRLVGERVDPVGRRLAEVLASDEGEVLDAQRAEVAPRVDVLTEDGVRVPVDWYVEHGDGVFVLFGDLAVPPNDDVLRRMTQLSSELLNTTRELQRRNAALEEARATIKVLSGVVPICAYCREIRDDQGYWRRVEEYLMEHSDLVLSHGICPRCQAKHFPKRQR